MAPVLAAAVALAWVAVAAGDEEAAAGCTITAKACKNFPEYRRTSFRDTIGEVHANTGGSDAACFKRAEDFHHWCANGAEEASVAATHNPSQISQVFHPNACEEGWSLWNGYCYKHFWEKKTWFEAEALCKLKGGNSHLASVHSRAENRFIYALTSGLSAWIGYSDLDQDKQFEWTDETKDDFQNFAKNCTGREHEPDCKPEERVQQWYEWDGGDAGTFICKKDSSLRSAMLLHNVTAQDLMQAPWDSLLPIFSGEPAACGDAPCKAAPSTPAHKAPPSARPSRNRQSAPAREPSNPCGAEGCGERPKRASTGTKRG